MRRKAIEDLKKWKNSPSRKPLVIRGARQVGKTWLMREFGRDFYQSVVYINMDSNVQMSNLFELDYEIERIIGGLEIASGVDIRPDTTLIIFDEIQEIPKALTALKYFYENAPEYHIMVAGSLLGVALHEGTSFPVGKVEFLDMYPLSFFEFLEATENRRLAELLIVNELDFEMINSFSPKIIDSLRTYYVTGGMPEVVAQYIKDGSLLGVRQTQYNILNAYDQDFSKHAPRGLIVKLREIWDSIPAQLAKENKKFIFRHVRESARARDYEDALLWLEDAGIASRVTRVNKPALPLKAYEDNNIFKLFLLDVGLLGAKAGLDPDVILGGNDVFQEFKGSLAEQYVFQEFRASGIDTYYFADENSRGEIDFMISWQNLVIPIEVKAEDNLKAKSLTEFVKKYDSLLALKLSAKPYRRSGATVNIPLYLAGSLDIVIENVSNDKQ